jgi:hypothetical protein
MNELSQNKYSLVSDFRACPLSSKDQGLQANSTEIGLQNEAAPATAMSDV